MDTLLDVNSTYNLLFPNQLDAEQRALISRFDKTLVGHRILQSVREQLYKAILYPGNRRIIFVVGPAGVGKTTLLEATDRDLWERARNDPGWHPGHIPTGKVEMRIIGGKPFDWYNYLVECLEAFHEPLISKKKRVKYSDIFPEMDPCTPRTTLKAKGVNYDELGNLWIAKDARLNGLYFALINTLYYRQPYCLLNDEAHHLTAVSGARGFLDQMNAIKSLANASGTVLVLFGIYDMYQLPNLNDQLIRRTRLIEFPRYDAHEKADWRSFRQLLSAFQSALPIKSDFDFAENDIWIYERTCGIPGVFKDWLVDALVYAFLHDLQGRFREACMATAPSDIEVVSRINRVLASEQNFRPVASQLEDARKKLGLSDEEGKPPESEAKRTRKRVGLPLPQHYTVGSESWDKE